MEPSNSAITARPKITDQLAKKDVPMQTVILALATFPPMLVMLVVIHELGHYLAARAFKIKVTEIGIGYPPRALVIYRGATEVKITPETRILDHEQLGCIKPGQVIRLLSTEDANHALTASYVERSRRQAVIRNVFRRRRQSTDKRLPVGDHLVHEGRVRSVYDEAIIVADTACSLNWLPLGGFVRVAGDTNPNTPRGLAGSPAWQRIIVLVAGSAMNALFPVVAFTFIFLLPYPQPAYGVIDIDMVQAGSPADLAGLRPKDSVIAIDGNPVRSPAHLAELVAQSAGMPMSWRVERHGAVITKSVTPRTDPLPGQGPIGISYRVVYPEDGKVRVRPPWEAAHLGVSSAWQTLVIMGEEIRSTLNIRQPDVMGPVGIAHSTGQIAQANGFHGWLVVAIVLSINLAIVNILPIPMLDGGRLLFVLVECARGGRRVPAHKEHFVHMLGFVTMLALLIAISAKDLIYIAQVAASP